jgi:magnesium-transporting ATPase (P-type)
MGLTAELLEQSIQRKVQHESAQTHGHEIHHDGSGFDDSILQFESLGKELTGRADFVEYGLPSTKVHENRGVFGTNQIELPPMPSYYSLICEGLEDPTLRILLVSAVISLVLGFSKPKDNTGIEGFSVLLTVVVVVNVQALTNYNKSREFRKQQEELEKRKSITAIRDKQILALHPRNLVVGDLVRAKVGTVIPADGVLVSGELWMDESALTGESRLVAKKNQLRYDIRDKCDERRGFDHQRCGG